MRESYLPEETRGSPDGAAAADWQSLSRLPKPVWRLINSPFLTAGLCLLGATVAFFWSIHMSLLFVSASYIFLAYYVERKSLATFIVPPLAIFAVANFFNSSLGAFLSAEDIFSSTVDAHLTTHLVLVGTFPILILVYWMVNRSNPPVAMSDNGRVLSYPDNQRLRFVAASVTIFTVALHYVSISSGLADRGSAGDFVLDTPYGYWSYFAAFSKLQYIAYMLVPYLYVTSGRLVRIGLVVGVCVYVLFEAANSSRGAVVFPFIFIVCGYWMIGGSFRRTAFAALWSCSSYTRSDSHIGQLPWKRRPETE